MEEEQQNPEQPEVMSCSEPRSHCSPIETDSVEASATASLHGPSPEVEHCGIEGPFPCKSDDIKSVSSTNGPLEPELQGPGGEGSSERASNPNEVERASDLNEVERASNLSEVESASKPSVEERASNLSKEERVSNLSKEERASNLSEEERVSNPNDEERTSNLSEEERLSNTNEVSAGEINGQSQPQRTAEEEEDQPENVSDSASTDNTLEDSSEFVVTVLARGTLEDQGEGPPSGLSEASTPAQGPAPSNQDEDVTAESWRRHRKHVFVLSEAGKPIYSRYGNEEALSSTMGVMMALVSFVQSGDNAIRSIYSDEHTVVFMQQGPLVLVSVSCSRQSEQQLRCELIYVYNQIVSMLTQASINRIFERKKNYDLRRLLAGSEKILDGLLNLVDSDPSFLLSAVHCLPLASSLRDSLSQILQKAITPNLVFSILIAKNQLLTIVQEKTVIEDARLEPADLHLLLNLIGASSAFQAGEIWTPICLPLFNPDCYFYAYISYLDPPECTVCLLLLSTDKEAFYAVAECKRKIDEGMRTQNALCSIAKAQSYSASQVGVSDLRHFMYKPFDVPENHRQLTQFTSPEMEAPYSSEEEKTRLLDLYRYMHSRIHSTSRPLKLIYHVAERETLLAWVTSKFELYTCFSPLVTKASAINAITKLLRWIKKEEDHLFIRSPPKYSTTPNPSKSSRGAKGGSDRQDTTDNGFLTLL